MAEIGGTSSILLYFNNLYACGNAENAKGCLGLLFLNCIFPCLQGSSENLGESSFRFLLPVQLFTLLSMVMKIISLTKCPFLSIK